MTSDNKKLHIVAGPNGSGKSTYTRLKKFGIPVLDPDAISRQLNAGVSRKFALESGREVVRLSQKYLDSGQSFVRETTLAGNSTINLIKKAKNKGYAIDFSYFCLDNWKTLRKRIDKRVSEGGHDISTIDIKRKYYRSLDNFKEAFELADKASVFDSTTSELPILIAAKSDGFYEICVEKLPNWAEDIDFADLHKLIQQVNSIA